MGWASPTLYEPRLLGGGRGDSRVFDVATAYFWRRTRVRCGFGRAVDRRRGVGALAPLLRILEPLDHGSLERGVASAVPGHGGTVLRVRQGEGCLVGRRVRASRQREEREERERDEARGGAPNATWRSGSPRGDRARRDHARCGVRSKSGALDEGRSVGRPRPTSRCQKIKKSWGLGGIEPPTTSTLRKYHATRPKPQTVRAFCKFEILTVYSQGMKSQSPMFWR